MPTTVVAGTTATQATVLLREYLADNWTQTNGGQAVPIVWPNEPFDSKAYLSTGYVRAFVVPITADEPESQRRERLVETEELLALWICTPKGAGDYKARAWYDLLAHLLEATTLGDDGSLHVYEPRRVIRGEVESFYRVDLQARLIRQQVTRIAGWQPPLEGRTMLIETFPGHPFGAATLPAAFAWSSGSPVVPTLTASATGAVGVVSAVSGDLLTLHLAGEVVTMVHGLGAVGPRWINASGALVSSEPTGLKQLVLEVLSLTRYHVRIGAVYA